MAYEEGDFLTDVCGPLLPADYSRRVLLADFKEHGAQVLGISPQKVAEVMARFKDKRFTTDDLQLVDRVNVHSLSNGVIQVEVNPDAQEGLHDIYWRHFEIRTFSNGGVEPQRIMLDKAGLAPWIQDCYSSNPYGRKTEADTFRKLFDDKKVPSTYIQHIPYLDDQSEVLEAAAGAGIKQLFLIDRAAQQTGYRGGIIVVSDMRQIAPYL